MPIADIPGAHQRVVMSGRARLTHKYAIEVTLYNFDWGFGVDVIWDPHLPSPAKQNALALKLEEELAPYYAKALEMGGLLERKPS